MTHRSFPHSLVTLVAAACVSGGLSSVCCSFAAETAPQKRVLSGKALQDALQLRRGLNTTGLTLRRVVTDLRQNTGISVLLDRRIDPSTPVNVTTDYVTTQEVIERLGSISTRTTTSFGEHFVLIGPIDAAGRLRTLTEMNRQAIQNLRRKMNAEMFRKLVEPHDASWPNLTEPRQTLMDAAQAVGVTIENPEAVPHDLWSDAELPALPFSDVATLVLNQFDLNFELSVDGTMRLVPVPEKVTIEETLRVSSKDKDRIIQQWTAAFPELDITWKGSVASVSTTVETHEKLKQMIHGRADTEVAAASIKNRMFTMKVPRGVTVGTLIASFRQQGIPIRVEGRSDADLVPLLETTVEFDLTQSPASEFFETVFSGLGAKVTVEDDEVVLTFR